MQKAALYTAGAIFAVGCIFHAVRLAKGIDIVVESFVVPGWVSLPAVIVGALLTIWMVMAAQRS